MVFFPLLFIDYFSCQLMAGKAFRVVSNYQVNSGDCLHLLLLFIDFFFVTNCYYDFFFLSPIVSGYYNSNLHVTPLFPNSGSVLRNI